MNVKITTIKNEEIIYKYVRSLEDMVIADDDQRYIVLHCFVGNGIYCQDEQINKKTISKIEIELL